MITLLLLAASAVPIPQSNNNLERNAPVAPEQVLAWQLEGLTQEEIREEVGLRGLTQCADDALLTALAGTRAEAETVRAVKQAKAPCTVWKLGLQLPRETDYLYEAAGAIRWSDWGYALQVMQREASKQPGNADVRLIYAHMLRMAEDWITAYGEARAAVELAPRSPYVHALLSTICYHSRLAQCAAREATVFVKMRPADAAAYIVLGHAEELQGHDSEALLAYTDAKRMNAKYAEIYAGLGRVYARAGECEKAVNSLQVAIHLDDDEAEYYVDLAQIYEAEGNMGQAISEWKKAKEIEPERSEILLGLANAYLVAERYSEAIAGYKELMKNAPEVDVRVQLAKAVRAEGREEETGEIEQGVEDPTTHPYRTVELETADCKNTFIGMAKTGKLIEVSNLHK